MSNSSLVDKVIISPNKNSPRNNKIQKITIHHMAGNLSIETCGNVFQTRPASSNYGIGTDGRVGMYVEEKDRSWASSSPLNDNQAITIEVANDGGEPDWHISDTAIIKCIELCTDICKRNAISRLNYTDDEKGNLTRHNMFSATLCPGPYLQSKFPYIANEVNKRLSGEQDGGDDVLYRVQTGAFSKKANAENLVEQLKNNGYDAFIVEPEKMEDNPPNVPTKSIDELAREVIAGEWGNGDERRVALENAGYDYRAVQDRVNDLL